jgi:5-methylcytosine-specific restriction protein A
MPSIPSNTTCAHLGCKNSKSKYNQYCIQHGGRDEQRYNQKYNRERKAFNDMYNTTQWLKLRQIQLSKHPLCVGCQAEGIIKAAKVVDHLFPWSHISNEAFIINRFQSLCTTHHSEKTQLEQKGIYRAFGTPHRDYTSADYARVMGTLDSGE